MGLHTAELLGTSGKEERGLSRSCAARIRPTPENTGVCTSMLGLETADDEQKPERYEQRKDELQKSKKTRSKLRESFLNFAQVITTKLRSYS